MVQHGILQRSIEEAILHPAFTASLPPLSDKTWMNILSNAYGTRAENERLEFVGDALMYATLARQLYAQIPNGTPHLYTCVRAALHSNATFSLLAEKLDIMAVTSSVLEALTRRTFGESTLAPHKTRPEVKATADLFETIIGAYYLDCGFEALSAWVEEIYRPLIKAVAKAFFAHQHGPNGTKTGPGMKKRHVAPLTFRSGPLTTPALQRYRGTSGAPISKKNAVIVAKQHSRKLENIKAIRLSRSPPRKVAIIGTTSTAAKLAKVSAKPGVNAGIAPLAPALKKTPVFIDLTLDSDTDDRERAFRHPLVTPRLPRSSIVSKRSTPVPPPVPGSLPALVADTGTSSCSSESDDEIMLESMLIPGSDSGSDMDCSSSDVETPARPNSFLVRTGYGDSAQQVSSMYRNVFLR